MPNKSSLRATNPIACGHRGHAVEVPEQRMAAYRRAPELGATMIEPALWAPPSARTVNCGWPRFMTLEPGDIIATGTHSGIGDASKHYLQKDEIVEGSISQVGVLHAIVVAPRET
jgi:Fumarylacetoacetate (FAA) hydrolase family